MHAKLCVEYYYFKACYLLTAVIKTLDNLRAMVLLGVKYRKEIPSFALLARTEGNDTDLNEM